jgi:hypothetical protein
MAEASRTERFSQMVSIELAPRPAGRWVAEQLEAGHIVYFPSGWFSLDPADRSFLLQQRQSAAAYHKNIAYRPLEDRLTGAETSSGQDASRLRAVLRTFSQRATEFVRQWLAPYGQGLQLDFASFRPIEEQGRPLRRRARNDLLHTDAFPTRPTFGDRILRFFLNINPERPRRWATAETFEPLLERYGAAAGLGRAARMAHSRAARMLRQTGRALGLTVPSPYDRFMLRFHHFLKENDEFQRQTPRQHWEFPPGSSWMVYTDMVSHAVLSGQFALEQTFRVDHHAMLEPARCPAGVLERLCGVPLTDRAPLFAR